MVIVFTARLALSPVASLVFHKLDSNDAIEQICAIEVTNSTQGFLNIGDL